MDHLRPKSTVTVAYTGTAGTATAVGGNIHHVRVWVTTDAFVSFGDTATTGDMFMVANQPETFSCHPGDTISAIQSASGGSLYVTSMTG